MRRTLRLALSLAVILVPLAFDVAGAVPDTLARRRLLSYKGVTSQERSVRFEVDRPESGDRTLTQVWFEFRVVCEDSSVRQWGVGIGYGRQGLPMDADHRFSDDQNYPDEFRMRFSGRLGSHRGSGLTELDVFQTAAGEFQDCTSGPRTWRARKVHTRWARSPAVDVMVRISIADDGGRRVSIDRR